MEIDIEAHVAARAFDDREKLGEEIGSFSRCLCFKLVGYCWLLRSEKDPTSNETSKYRDDTCSKNGQRIVPTMQIWRKKITITS